MHSALAGQVKPAALTRPSTLLHKLHRSQTRPICKAATKDSPYKAPSSSTAATELDSLRRYSNVVPDTVLMQELSQPGRPEASDLEAATVSSYVLTGILKNPSGLHEHKMAIERALLYDVCAAVEDPTERAGCELDKALVNIGSLLLQQVAGDGRVSTEVDPRLAYDAGRPHHMPTVEGKLTRRVMNLVQQYQDMGSDISRIIFRIPGTWEGIQAAKDLEARGIATHIILINSYVQAVAAAQAGVSVIQPNIGRIGDWFNRNPGAIKNPKGPREDSGSSSDENPAIKLVERIYNYCQQKHPKTKVMAAGIRRKEEALALSGVDYLVLGPRVIASLANAATMQGYNDGMRSGTSVDGSDGGVSRSLSPESAKQIDFDPDETLQITKQLFQDGLGLAGLELLDEGIATLSSGVQQLEEAFQSRAFDRL